MTRLARSKRRKRKTIKDSRIRNQSRIKMEQISPLNWYKLSWYNLMYREEFKKNRMNPWMRMRLLTFSIVLVDTLQRKTADEHIAWTITMWCKLVNGCLMKEARRSKRALRSCLPSAQSSCVSPKSLAILIKKHLKPPMKLSQKKDHSCTCTTSINPSGRWMRIKSPVTLKMESRYLVKKHWKSRKKIQKNTWILH